ncbi:MAG: DUF3592 domain-containing protein [Planctomycetales bacterium]|nr:DUF3592 domain-containing protein [Planctomycetales bacterium]
MASKQSLLPLFFCGIFVAVGAVPLAMGVRGILRARQTLQWPTTEGRILSSSVRSKVSKSRDENRRERLSTYYYTDVEYEYAVEGKTYQGTNIARSDFQSGSQADAEALQERYTKDARVVVSYDPQAPDQAVIEPGKWGNAGWLILFGSLFAGIPGLMAYGMLSKPRVKSDPTIRERQLQGVVFKEKILQWSPGERVHLHRAHEPLYSIIIGSIFVGLLLGLFFGMIPAGFFFSHFGMMFVIKSYFVISGVLAVAFGCWYGLEHRRRDTCIDWAQRSLRIQVGWFVREYTVDQVQKLTYRSPLRQAEKDAANKSTARVEVTVADRKYVLLECDVTRQQAKMLRGKLQPLLDSLSAALDVGWDEQAMVSPLAAFTKPKPEYTREDRSLVEAIKQVGGKVEYENNEVRVVDLSEIDGTDGILEILVHFPTLEHVSAKGKKITDQAVRHLLRLPNLRALDLHNTSLSSEGLRRLQQLQHLEMLSLKGTRIRSEAILSVVGMPALEELDLSYTAIDDQALEFLADCKELTSLDVKGTNVSSPAIQRLRQRLPDIDVDS